HEVGEGDVLIGHTQADHGFAPLSAECGLLRWSKVAIVPVVAEFGVPARGAVAFFDLLGAREGFVRVAGLQELRGDVGVDVHPLGLPVRAVRAADLHPLVPVQPEPAEGVEELFVGLLRVPRRIGVFDPEDELPAGVAGVGPVEQGGSDQPDVRGAGGRGAKAYAYFTHDAPSLLAPPASPTLGAYARIRLRFAARPRLAPRHSSPPPARGVPPRSAPGVRALLRRGVSERGQPTG